MFRLYAVAALLVVGGAAQGAVSIAVSQGELAELAQPFSSTDLIEGKIPAVLPGDRGWHPVNTDPADQLAAFTDGIGLRQTGLTGLLNDFPPAGEPTKVIDYDLGGLYDISEIRVFSGNTNRDGRVFHTYTAEFSADGANYTPPIYVQSHPSGTINDKNLPDPPFHSWLSVLTQLTDTSGPLANAVSHVRLKFYGVDNTQGQMRDPFDGVNTFTHADDGLTAPNSSPLIWEIDVFGDPATPTEVTSIGEAKTYPDDTLVSITTFQVMTVDASGEVPGAFYMQGEDGAAGIRVEPFAAEPFASGKKVKVTGRLSTNPTNGERVLANARVDASDPGPGVIKIWKLNNRDFGGTGYTNQDGSPSTLGLVNEGLLTSIAGKLTHWELELEPLASNLWLDDGSNVLYSGSPSVVGIKIINSVLFVDDTYLGKYYTATGVVVPEIVDGKKVRVLRSRFGDGSDVDPED